MSWHSKKDRNERAKRMGIEGVPDGNPREPCDTCPRVQSVDMLMRYRGNYICDGCWTDLRRKGNLHIHDEGVE